MQEQGSALTGLAAVLGAGGISGIITAVMSYISAARKGRRDDDEPSSFAIHLGRDVPHNKWDEISSGHLGTIAAGIVRIAAVQELRAEEAFEGKDFGDRLSTKEIRILRDLMAHDKDERHGR